MRRALLTLVLAAFAAATVHAQSLGEIAAREKRRREEEQKKNKGPARVVTTEDLANVQAKTATEARPQSAQELGGKPASSSDEIDRDKPPSETPSGSASGSGQERGGQDEKTWRTQAQDLRNEIQEREQKLRALEQEKGKIGGDMLRSTDTNEILRMRGQQQQVDEQIATARRELEGVRTELAQFQESARRAGVPPGWIR
jgi:hypothetical protein